MTVESWLAAAIAHAEAHGLPELKPLLETLARSTASLRRADEDLRTPGTTPPAPRTPAV